MRSSTAYLIFSAVVVLAGFVLSVATRDSSLSDHSSVAVVNLFFFGNATAWTILFVVGLLRYGIAALWLLVVAPFAFYQVGLFVLLVLFFGAH